MQYSLYPPQRQRDPGTAVAEEEAAREARVVVPDGLEAADAAEGGELALSSGRNSGVR